MTIPTIKRRKWHGKDKWQVTNKDGSQWSTDCPFTPIACAGYWVGDVMHAFNEGPKRRPPADWTSTLRRIEPVRRRR